MKCELIFAKVKQFENTIYMMSAIDNHRNKYVFSIFYFSQHVNDYVCYQHYSEDSYTGLLNKSKC